MNLQNTREILILLWKETPSTNFHVMLHRKASFQIRTACKRRVFSKAKVLHLYEHRAHASSALLSWPRAQYSASKSLNSKNHKYFWKEYHQYERSQVSSLVLPKQLTLTLYQQTWASTALLELAPSHKIQSLVKHFLCFIWPELFFFLFLLMKGFSTH